MSFPAWTTIFRVVSVDDEKDAATTAAAVIKKNGVNLMMNRNGANVKRCMFFTICTELQGLQLSHTLPYTRGNPALL